MRVLAKSRIKKVRTHVDLLIEDADDKSNSAIEESTKQTTTAIKKVLSSENLVREEFH